jgi:hypothetical protein
MTPEDQQKLEEYCQGIAAILYRNAGIELAVREQMLENVSPKIGVFLSRQVVAQKQEKRGI